MNFTLKEYFYKLYNRGLIMLLLPLAEFLAVYYLLLSGILPSLIQEEQWIELLLVIIPVIVLTALTIVHLDVQKRCRKISNEVSLGKKLELYYPVASRKINSVVWLSFLLAAGLFVTSHQWFSIYFGVTLLWCWWQWPTPRKVSSDLKLKGDERKMVLTKGEAFKF